MSLQFCVEGINDEKIWARIQDTISRVTIREALKRRTLFET